MSKEEFVDVKRYLKTKKKLYLDYPSTIWDSIKYYANLFYNYSSTDSTIFKNIYTGHYFNNYSFSEVFNDWYENHQAMLAFCFLNNDEYPFNVLKEMFRIHSVLKEKIGSVRSENDIEDIRQTAYNYINSYQKQLIEDYELTENDIRSLCDYTFNKDNFMILFYNNILKSEVDSASSVDYQFKQGVLELFFDYMLSYSDINDEGKVQLKFQPICIVDMSFSLVGSLLGSYSEHVLDPLYLSSNSIAYLTRSRFYEIMFKFYFYNKKLTEKENLEVFSRLVKMYRPLLNRYGYNSHVEPYRSVSFSVIDKVNPKCYETLARKEGVMTNEHLLTKDEHHHYNKGKKVNKIMSLSSGEK